MIKSNITSRKEQSGLYASYLYLLSHSNRKFVRDYVVFKNQLKIWKSPNLLL